MFVRVFGLVAVLLSMMVTLDVKAGSLKFSPQRIIIDARHRTASLTLTNSGKKITGYRIEMVDMLYGDDGMVRQATQTPASYPTARHNLRFSPRQVRLKPGETQKIRILVRGSRKMPAGEYRVHAKLSSLPDVSKIKNPAKVAANTVQGTVGMKQAVALPIIIRRGKTSAQGHIASMRVKSGKTTRLDLKLGRTGNRSLYTNVILRDQTGRLVTQVKGIALPVPNAFRRYFLRIPGLSANQVKSGGYKLELVDHDSGQVLDSKAIQ